MTFSYQFEFGFSWVLATHNVGLAVTYQKAKQLKRVNMSILSSLVEEIFLMLCASDVGEGRAVERFVSRANRQVKEGGASLGQVKRAGIAARGGKTHFLGKLW